MEVETVSFYECGKCGGVPRITWCCTDAVNFKPDPAKMEQAIREALRMLGPTAPLCSGCVSEWNAAISILRESLGMNQDEQSSTQTPE